MDHIQDQRHRTEGAGPIDLPPAPTMMDAAGAADAVDGRCVHDRRRSYAHLQHKCRASLPGGDVTGRSAAGTPGPAADGAPCQFMKAAPHQRGTIDASKGRYKRRRRRNATQQSLGSGRLCAMLLVSMLLAFVGCVSGSLETDAAPHTELQNAPATSPRTLQSWIEGCEGQNFGQCEKDITCVWAGGMCITLPIPGPPTPSQSTPWPSGTPTEGATSPSLPQDWTRPPTAQPTTRAPTMPPTPPPTTGRPTNPPSRMPTRQPVREPTEGPSSVPSDVPTRRPTRKPTMRPTQLPSMEPSSSPTNRPTRRPSKSPSASPSFAPSPSPSGSPSASPTYRPSASPSQSPTISSRPTPLIWPSASPTVSSFPTSDPTAAPSESPSTEPTWAPSLTPSTSSPTPFPAKMPLPATETPSKSPAAPTTPRPTFRNQIFVVESSMKLVGLGGKMDRDEEETWISTTENVIMNEALKMIGNEGSDLLVALSRIKQGRLAGRRRISEKQRRTPITKYGAFPIDETPQHQYGYLRRLQSSSLQINFTTTIKFNSGEEWNDEDANDMVANGFRTPAQQEAYINSLKAEDSDTFGPVQSMTLEVEGELVTQTEDSNELKPVSSNNGPIIGGVVGGALLLLVVMGGVYYARKRRSSDEAPQPGKSASLKPSMPQDRTPSAQGGFPTSPPREAFQSQPSPSPAQGYFGTIESREGEDDVSTLGDPYFGEGVNPTEPRADETVAESMISSEQEMYVFGVGRQRLMTGGSTTITGGTQGNPNRMIFGEDLTLEDAYRSPDAAYGGDAPTALKRLTVIAPSGKLGIVIDNQSGDMPIVHAIKETSPLNGKVNVGDLLISVDEMDCRGMTAVQVSRLISSRSHNSARTLVLLRGAGNAL